MPENEPGDPELRVAAQKIARELTEDFMGRAVYEIIRNDYPGGDAAWDRAMAGEQTLQDQEGFTAWATLVKLLDDVRLLSRRARKYSKKRGGE